MADREQFDADVKSAKAGLYKDKDDNKIRSRVRGLGPSMAAKRLEEQGVDIPGLVANVVNPENLGNYKKGGYVKAADGIAQRGKTKGSKVSSASSRADGCATKGKTRGTMITMKGGGYAC